MTMKQTNTHKTMEQIKKHTNTIQNSLFIYPTCTNEIIINDLNINKSPGLDNIPCKVIKTIAEIIAKPLAFIVNKCIEEAIFPEIFKTAVVVTIFKSGDPTLPTNYRPISLISHLAKIFEKILETRIENFILKHKIVSSKQYGFQKGKKTEDALIYVTDIISKAIDINKPCITIFLDLEKHLIL